MAHTSERAVARAVLTRGPISRRDLAALLDLSASSLTRLTKPLLDRGLVVELPEETGGRLGRPTRPLDASPTIGQFVGVKLTGTEVHAVLTDARMAVLADAHHTFKDTTPENVADLLAASVEELPATHLRGVGVSLGGTVHDRTVLRAPFLRWQDVPLGELLDARLNVPVTLENDVVALTRAEQWFGIGRDIPAFTLVTIGAGVGFGLVVDGEVVASPDAGVGTAGHIPLCVESASLPAPCGDGHRSCATALLTEESLAAWASRECGRTLTYPEMLTLAEDPHSPAADVADVAARALGQLIALTVNLSLQADVVLTGEGTELYQRRRDLVAATIARHRDVHARPVKVHVDVDDFTPWARGAAAAAVQEALLRL